MDTVKKGDKLEDDIFDLFSDMIEKDTFIVKKEFCRIYKQKGYYSKDREKNIKFDISIEATFPNENTYSLLFLIECKNYNHRVPVDDAEEFFAKTQQISGANIKAIIASTNSFQSGAVTFSKSKGIGLLRYFPPSKLSWELTRSPSSFISSSHTCMEWSTAHKGILEQSYKSQYFDFYTYFNDIYTNSLNLLFDNMSQIDCDKKDIKKLKSIKNKVEVKPTVKYISKEEIESIAINIQEKINYKSGLVSLDLISKWLSKHHKLKIFHKDLPEEILGKVNFSPFRIILNSNELNHARKNFTLSHEIGHYLLEHHNYMTGESLSKSDIDMENQRKIAIKDIMKMEYQANYFASCLLLPKKSLTKSFLTLISGYELKNRGHGVLYLDNQLCNLNIYHTITDELMKIYSVSRTALKIRLKELGLITEEEKQKKCRQFNEILTSNFT